MSNHQPVAGLLAALGLGALLTCLATASAQGPALPSANHAPASPQEGIEVQTRGPLHEGYAEPASPKPGATPVVPRKPPDPIEEVPADQKPEGDNVQWIPGYWAWDDDRNDFLWVSGFWRVPPPSRQWVPGHWRQAANGWQWVPGFWSMSQQSELTYQPPPPDPVEAAPSVPAPGPDYAYVPGTWVYRDTRYVWRPGVWSPCRPGWVWVPAHYVWTPCGYVFVEGYWDYPLRERGLLFAPVCIDPVVYARPAFVYRPRYVIHDDCLYGALFVRPACHHYYFGDYFEARYSRAGYTSWFDFRIGFGCSDPLYTYYRWHHRHDPRWDTGLRDLYAGRYGGAVARPPRTLVQQNTLVQNITVNHTTINNTTVNNLRNVRMVSPVSQLDRNVVRMQPVSQESLLVQKQAAQQLRQVGLQRKQLETTALAQAPPPVKPTDAPRVVKIELPRTLPQHTTSPAKAPPPPPVRPELRTAVQPVTPAQPGAIKPPVPLTQPQPTAPKPVVKPAPAPVKPEIKPTVPTPRPEVRPTLPTPKPPAVAPAPEVKPAVPAPRPPTVNPRPEVKPTVPTPRPEVRPPTAPTRPPVVTPRPEPRPQVQPVAPKPEAKMPPPRNSAPPPAPPRPAPPPPPRPAPMVPRAPAVQPSPRPASIAAPRQPAPAPTQPGRTGKR